MPSDVPAKVNISPNATSTDESMTPMGGTINPAISRQHPTTISIIVSHSWIWSRFSLSGLCIPVALCFVIFLVSIAFIAVYD